MMTRKLSAEFLGTFFLVFAGTGAIAVDSVSGGLIGHVGIALTLGLVVFAMIQTFGGPISGASINPARSLGPAVTVGNLSTLWLYCCAPTLGALLAVPFCQWLHSMPKDQDPA